MPASPTSPIRMATAGCYKNGATVMCEVSMEASPLAPGGISTLCQLIDFKAQCGSNQDRSCWSAACTGQRLTHVSTCFKRDVCGNSLRQVASKTAQRFQ